MNRIILGNTRQLPGQFETSGAVLGALRSNALYRRPDNYWSTIADRYRAMDKAHAGRDRARATSTRTISSGWWSATRPWSARSCRALGLPIEELPAGAASAAGALRSAERSN